MRKLTILLLSVCVFFSFGLLMACGGSGGGSDDDDDWPVEFYKAEGGSPVSMMKTAPATGIYKYIYFNKNNTYESGDLNNGTLTKTGEGSYSGGDPHNNVTLSLSGTFEGSTLSGESVTIGSGSLTIAGQTFARGGSSSGNGGGTTDPTPTPAVTWPVSYQADISGMTGTPGTFGYVDFYEDGTYLMGDGINGVKGLPDNDPSGTYTGDDPHGDGSVRVTGDWAGSPANNLLVTINGGIFDFAGLEMVRQ